VSTLIQNQPVYLSNGQLAGYSSVVAPQILNSGPVIESKNLQQTTTDFLERQLVQQQFSQQQPPQFRQQQQPQQFVQLRQQQSQQCMQKFKQPTQSYVQQAHSNS
jgi:hypothetical protein